MRSIGAPRPTVIALNESPSKCTGYGVGCGDFKEIEDASNGWFEHVQELESHQDHQHSPIAPAMVLLGNRRYLPIWPAMISSGRRMRTVPIQNGTARTDAGDKAEDEDSQDGGVEGSHFKKIGVVAHK